MPLTRDFKETIRARVENDAESGEIEVGKSLLRDHINATIEIYEFLHILH